MKYFISRNGQEYGPYTLADLQRYVASGNIVVTDLTRSEGMSDWVPVSQVIGTIPVPAVAQTRFPASPTEPIPRREGNMLIVPHGAVLPHYCVKCGRPGQDPPLRKTFTWYNPWLNLLILCGLLVLLIVYFIVRKQMTLSMFLCEEHKRQRRKRILIGSLILLSSPLLLIIGIAANSDSTTATGVFVLLGMLIAGAIVCSFATPLRVRKIDTVQAEFGSAGEEFLQLIESPNRVAAGSGL